MESKNCTESTLRRARLLLVVLVAFTVSACSCEKEKTIVDLSKPPAPLVLQSVPHSLETEVYPVEGSTTARPVAIVLDRTGEMCRKIRDALGQNAHVLCSQLGSKGVGAKVKTALAYLKKSYPRHVDQAPVALFSGPQNGKVAWRMMLAEPGFFAHVYIRGLNERVFTSTTLSALNAGGAKTLVVAQENTKRLQFLATVARRRGLSLYALGEDPAALSKAFKIIQSADPRFASAP